VAGLHIFSGKRRDHYFREGAPKDSYPRMKYAVKYAALDFPRTEFTHNALFYYKPSGYGIEREYRLLRSPDEDEVFYPDNPQDWFRRVPIKTKKIVHRVITHPYATPATKLRVEELLRRFLPSRRRDDSALEM
jgi:hypothetical protein